jgi:TatD DNase family protein
MELVDTHCHLTEISAENLQGVFDHAFRCSVNRFICVGSLSVTKGAFEAVELAERHSSIWATIGIHPHDAGSTCSLESLVPLAAHPRVVAIGETGLDFYRDWAPRDLQEELFRNSIALALRFKKPLIIHCRTAAEETLRILIECGASSVGGVFHCYSEDASFAERIAEMNFLVSFTGNITFKKAHALHEAVRAIPLEGMMLETDTPYMAPEPFRGKPSEPMHVYQIAHRVAELKNLSFEEIAAVTTKTAERFFGLSPASSSASVL